MAPDVTGVADERRPPPRRPPRPCLSQRSGSRSPGRLPGWELGCPGPPPRPLPLRGAPQAGMRPGRPRREPGDAAGTAATPARAGPKTQGPVRARGGGGDRDGEAGGRGRRTGQLIRSARGLAPTQSSAPRAAGQPRGHSPARQGEWSWERPPPPALFQTSLEKLYSRATRRA